MKNMDKVIGTVQLVLIVLKVIGAITWSWWLVLLPLWIGIILFLIIIFIGGIVLAVGKDKVKDERQKEIDRMWNGKHGEDD